MRYSGEDPEDAMLPIQDLCDYYFLRELRRYYKI